MNENNKEVGDRHLGAFSDREGKRPSQSRADSTPKEGQRFRTQRYTHVDNGGLAE